MHMPRSRLCRTSPWACRWGVRLAYRNCLVGNELRTPALVFEIPILKVVAKSMVWDSDLSIKVYGSRQALDQPFLHPSKMCWGTSFEGPVWATSLDSLATSFDYS